MKPQLALNGRSGSVNLFTLFHGKLLVVDREVAKFLGIVSSAALSFTEPGHFYANWVQDPASKLLEIDRNTALGILQFLDGASASSETLNIASGENELNLIFGIIVVERQRRVLYLEHEHEDGKEEQYHLHSRPVTGYVMKVKNSRRYLTSAP